MKAASRLLATAKPSRLLEVGSPTGITGLRAHPSPRTSLLYYYTTTLEKLKQFPEDSVYRQATENLTRQRLQAVEKIKPDGYDEWEAKVQKQLNAKIKWTGRLGGEVYNGFFRKEAQQGYDEDEIEWDGQDDTPALEGSRSAEERKDQRKALGEGLRPEEEDLNRVEVDPEPRYSYEQVEQLETDIGAGLLEEVIQVAESEHKLVEVLLQAKVWEELEVKAPEGQWTYFERGTHQPKPA